MARTAREAGTLKRGVDDALEMTREAKPQVVVVTGATAGVGRATVRALARRGARIGLLARGVEGLEATRREVEGMGGHALAIPTDVADAAAVEAAAERVERELGPIDVWVNNAMASVFSPIVEMTSDEYRRVTEVTYLGYVYGVQSALKRMLPRDRGVIIHVGSALAYRGIPLQSAYCGAKHAIQGFTDSLRCELIHDGSGVRVTSVHLPAINTPQFRWVRSRLPKKSQPVPPIYQPEVAADAILFAIDHDRREVWVGKPVTQAIIGNRVAPWYLDRRLATEAWDGQMIEDEPYEPRPDNLWAARSRRPRRARRLRRPGHGAQLAALGEQEPGPARARRCRGRRRRGRGIRHRAEAAARAAPRPPEPQTAGRGRAAGNRARPARGAHRAARLSRTHRGSASLRRRTGQRSSVLPIAAGTPNANDASHPATNHRPCGITPLGRYPWCALRRTAAPPVPGHAGHHRARKPREPRRFAAPAVTKHLAGA
jgi:NAD(P)-dependent dehydrogenase (short-subunit alcohol dehydrogenase family)